MTLPMPSDAGGSWCLTMLLLGESPRPWLGSNDTGKAVVQPTSLWSVFNHFQRWPEDSVDDRDKVAVMGFHQWQYSHYQLDHGSPNLVI